MVVAILLTLVAGACGAARHATGTRTDGHPSQPGDATITRVVDGDTVQVEIGGHKEKVRLIGIDTPESVKPNTPVQCFALQASARTKALLPPGTPVRLVSDVEARDRYGRLLAYVYRARDDLFVNRDLVDEGFAVPYTLPPNVAHADEFVAAAGRARDAGLGLWGQCGDEIPRHP